MAFTSSNISLAFVWPLHNWLPFNLSSFYVFSLSHCHLRHSSIKCHTIFSNPVEHRVNLLSSILWILYKCFPVWAWPNFSWIKRLANEICDRMTILFKFWFWCRSWYVIRAKKDLFLCLDLNYFLYSFHFSSVLHLETCASDANRSLQCDPQLGACLAVSSVHSLPSTTLCAGTQCIFTFIPVAISLSV